MTYPKFEINIEDQFTITENNKVGADNRGNVKETGTSELVVNLIPSYVVDSWKYTIQDVINYANANGYDVVTLGYGTAWEILENYINVPDGMILQAGNGFDVTITFTDYVLATQSDYSRITTPLYEGGAYEDCFCVANGTDLYRFFPSTAMTKYTRAFGGTKTYRALCTNYPHSSFGSEISIISDNDSGTGDIMAGTTAIKTGVTNIITTIADKPRIHLWRTSTPTTTGELYIRMTGSNRNIKKLAVTYPSTVTETTITCDAPLGYSGSTIQDFCIAKGQYLCSTFPSNMIKAIALFYGVGNSNEYATACYKTLDFTSASTIDVLVNARLSELIYFPNFYGSPMNFMGGNQIVRFDGTNFYTEKLLDYTPTYCKFYTEYDTPYEYRLFFIAHNSEGYTEIYERQSDGTWERVRYIKGKMVPLGAGSISAAIWENNILLWKNLNEHSGETLLTNCVYFYRYSETYIKLNDDSKLIGMKIKAIDDYFSLKESFSTAGSYGTGSEIKYCTIESKNSSSTYYAIGGNIDTLLSNSKIKTVGSGVTGCYSIKHCLIESDNYGINHTGMKYISGAYRSYIENNTIKALNGILMNVGSVASFTTCKNNIIDASNYALYTDNLYTYTVLNSLINGLVDDNFTLTNCKQNYNPLFKSDEDFKLMSKAEGYPKNSVAIGLGDDSKDAGCYDITRTNNGETLKETFEITNYLIDIAMGWEYTKKETSFDYRSNFIKSMEKRCRVFTLLNQNAGIPFEVVCKMEYLIGLDSIIRFYPFNTDGVPFIIDKTTTDLSEYVRTATLTLDFTNMKATAPANHIFPMGMLKGGWLMVTNGGTTKHYYIEENTEDTLYLIDKEGQGVFSNGDYSCQVLWFYVRTFDTIDYLNAVWYMDNQMGKFPAVKLYVMEGKNL